MDGIEAQQMGIGLDRSQIIHGDDMNIFAAGFEYGAQNIAPDAPEPVDSHPNRHETLLSTVQREPALL